MITEMRYTVDSDGGGGKGARLGGGEGGGGDGGGGEGGGFGGGL